VILFERPPARSARWWAFDVFVALAVVGLSVPPWLEADVDPAWLAIVIGLAIATPILARRVWPVAVFGWVVATTCLAVAFDRHLVSGPAAVVALYTVAAYRPRKQALIAAAVLEAAVIGIAIDVRGADWWYATIFLSGLVAAALGLGLYATTRRAYLRELHDRAERLERERDQAHELAVITERARVIREMHDVVAHNLTVIVALSDGAAGSALRAPERAADIMRTVSVTGRQALADTRRLLGILGEGQANDQADDRHPAPDLNGLDALIARVRDAGLPVSYEIHGAAHTLPSAVQLTVYRLVQEALTNSLKHGGQDTHATVRLRYLPGELHVDIEDDGAGALAAVPATVGRGLTGMAERVHAFGGQVRSGPRTPRGWQVSAQLPIDDPAGS
jgi:signal transduction histidine kinase